MIIVQAEERGRTKERLQVVKFVYSELSCKRRPISQQTQGLVLSEATLGLDRDFKRVGMALLGSGIHDDEPAHDGFADVRFGFREGLALADTPGKRWNFRDVVARLVAFDDDV